jgi:hypothetical protein
MALTPAAVGGVRSIADWINELRKRGAVGAPATPPPGEVPPPDATEPEVDVYKPPERINTPQPYPSPSNPAERLLNDMAAYKAEEAYQQSILQDPKAGTTAKKNAAAALAKAQDDINRVNTQLNTEQARTQHPAKGAPIETIETYGSKQYRVHWTADGVGGKSLDTSKGTNGVEPMDLGPGERITANGQVYTLSNDGTTATPIAGVGPAVKVEQRNGRTYYSQDEGRTWTPAGGLPSTRERVTGADGVVYTLSEDGTSATPVTGVGRAVQIQQRGGDTFISKDGGSSWEKATGLPSTPTTQTVGGRLTGVNPLTGEKTFTTDLMTPEDRQLQDELDRLKVEDARRGTLPQNPLAAYTQEASRLQAAAQTELDRLRDLQRTGALSATDADAQFKQYLAQRVTPQLAGLKTQAEEAQRLERTQVEERNRLEQVRADTANRAREQVGYQAGETARSQIMQIAPEIRTPQFLQQYGSMVANMAGRANAPTAEAANRMPAAPTITADTFNPANFAGSIPNLDEAAKQATARALAGISPTAARLANMPTVNMPTGPDLQGMLNQLPYQGQLQRPPPGLQPLPDFAAVDQGNGMARSTYPGVNGGQGGWMDWAINAPPFGGSAPPPTGQPLLPGQLPGETEAQRLARFYGAR